MRSYGCGDTVMGKWLPGMKIFPKPTNFFSRDPLKIHSSIRKCNKKFLPLGTQHFEKGGGVEGDPLRINSSECVCMLCGLACRFA